LDKATADSTATATASADSTATDTSILPGDECYYRCPDKSVCSYDSTKCTWDDNYQQCWTECKEPTEPVDICNYRTSCECLADVKNQCGWCQTSGSVIYADGTGKPFVSGVCFPPSVSANKCTGSVSSGCYAGDFFTVAPTECTGDSTVDSLKDTSSYFSDATFQKIFSSINTGELKEAAMQVYANAYKAEGCDFVIKRILKADATADEGTVSTMIEVNNAGGKTEADICELVDKIYASIFEISESCLKNCKLLPYTDSGSTTVKRASSQSGSSTYIHTAIVDPSTAGSNSAGTLAPVWMMLFALFLFFRM